ncbi:hypothetical protein CAEBREN_09374 [Caenorhabditis brenneri]|uniref:Uncharacterized protein n=1 Tax=Caenorhabditis brenneri TaxID=135651 RepID=G0N264_CAEBE|nr:hypothetical protein CAEBREN_09374 [Caenorhabditis brenneri]
MATTSNVAQQAPAGNKLLESAHIHPRIQAAAQEILHRIETTPSYPKSESDLDYKTLNLLIHSVKTGQENDLLGRTWWAVYNAEQARNSPPEFQDKAPEAEEDWSNETTSDNDGEQSQKDDSWMVVPPLGAESEAQAETSFADNRAQPDSRAKAQGKSQQDVIFALEQKLLVSEADTLRLLEELRASKGREEEMKRKLEEMGRVVLEKCSSQDTQLDELQLKFEKQSLFVSELMTEHHRTAEALTKSLEEKAELQGTVTALEAKVEEYKEMLEEVPSFFVDNWTVAEEQLKLKAVILDLERKLRVTDGELEVSKEREEEMKKDVEEKKRTLTDKCRILEIQLHHAHKILNRHTRIMLNLIAEAELTTEKSQKKEAELQGTLKAQNENFMKILYSLLKECKDCRWMNRSRRLREWDEEKFKVSEDKKIDMEFVEAQMKYLKDLMGFRFE